MSNHSFVIDPQQGAEARVGDTLALTGAEAHHAVAVKRTQAGEQLDLLDGTGLRLVVEVAAVSKELLTVTVLERLQEQRRSRTRRSPSGAPRCARRRSSPGAASNPR